MKISFSGIYDIRYPYGTNRQSIKKECDDLKSYVDGKYNIIKDYQYAEVTLKNHFNTQKSPQKLAESGIRIITTTDNPYILSDIFEYADRNRKQDLVQQYIDKSKIELVTE